MARDMFGFLIGLGVGVGLGVLLAPRSGERTRSLIRGKASAGAAYLRQQGSDACDAAADAINGGARRVTRETEAVKAAVAAGKQAYSEAIHS